MENKTKNVLITEGSALIAQFMGLTPNPHDGGKTWANEVTYINGEIYGDNWWPLHYSTSWDWLMPVVQKIESMERTLVNIYGDGTVIAVDTIDGTEIYGKTTHGNKDNKIGHVYRAVVEFLEWYNETQSRAGV